MVVVVVVVVVVMERAEAVEVEGRAAVRVVVARRRPALTFSVSLILGICVCASLYAVKTGASGGASKHSGPALRGPSGRSSALGPRGLPCLSARAPQPVGG